MNKRKSDCMICSRIFYIIPHSKLNGGLSHIVQMIGESSAEVIVHDAFGLYAEGVEHLNNGL